MAITQNKVYALDLPHLVRCTLCVASGGHDGETRISLASRPKSLARLGVGHMGYGARVEYIDIGSIVETNDTISRLDKPPGKSFTIGLVKFATVSLDRYGTL